MNRMFGMMPRSEVKIEKRFDTGNGLKVTVQAGPNGWGILYADHSSEGQDVQDTTEGNLERAVAQLKSHFSTVKEISGSKKTAVSNLPNDVTKEGMPQEQMSPSPSSMGSMKPGDDIMLTGRLEKIVSRLAKE